MIFLSSELYVEIFDVGIWLLQCEKTSLKYTVSGD